MGLVLGEHAEPEVTGVDEIAQYEVDESVGAPEGNGWLGSVRGHRVKALTLTAGKHNP